MKSYFFILVFACLFLTAVGQRTINQSIPVTNINQLHCNFEYANVQISSWDNPSIQISGTALINDGLNDDAFKIEQSKNGTEISLRTYIDNKDKLPKTVTVVKDGQKYVFRNKDGNKKAIRKQIKETIGDEEYSMYSEGVQSEIILEVKVPKNLQVDIQSTYGDVILNNVTTPLKVENTYGHIEAVFSDLAKIKEVSLKSTYDFVDITVPDGEPLKVDLDSDYGKIFTDLELDIDSQRSKTKDFAYRIVGSVKNGGPLIKAKATYKNIYLRKAM